MRRVIKTTIVSFGALLGAIAFSAAPALAAAPEAPVTATPATSITATTATLEGTLNPGVKATAGYYFAYSPEISCLIPGFVTSHESEAEVKAQKVEAKVTGLQPNKEYHFCLVATNEGGLGETPGNEVTFETRAAAPVIASESAEVTETTATITAKVNPEGLETHVYVEYGEGRDTAPLNIGATVGEQELHFTLTGLHSGTTYPYHVIAFNSEGNVEGEHTSFATLKPPPAHGETPWWGVSSGARPTNLQAGGAASEVQKITVNSEGSMALIVPLIPGILEEHKLLVLEKAETVTHQVLQEKLESVLGAGNVSVTGGPGSPEPFLVTFTGDLSTRELPLLGTFNSTITVSEVTHGKPDGQVDVVAENLGDGDANGAEHPVTIEDTLPSGYRAVGVEALLKPSFGTNYELIANTELMKCGSFGAVPIVCTFSGVVPPYESLEARISVVLEAGATSGEQNRVSVSGGGAPLTKTVARALQIGGAPQFGVEENTLTAEEAGGGVDTQAGSHPFQVTNTLTFNHGAFTTLWGGSTGSVASAGFGNLFAHGLPKDQGELVPPGLIGNPTALPQCTDEQFVLHAKTTGKGGHETDCPLATVVGAATITVDEPNDTHLQTSSVPIFNMTPEQGEPARFGFHVDGIVPVFLDTAIRSGGDYGLTVSSHNISQIPGVLATTVTLWGVPGDPRHDQQRGELCLVQGKACPLVKGATPPLLVLPTSCAAPLVAGALVDSWEAPGEPVAFGMSEPMGTLDGCNRLAFNPTLEVKPDGSAASSPSGLTVDVHVPQTAELNPEGSAESSVRNITVALPEGVAVNPAGGDGLVGCSESQIGFQGFKEFEPGVRTATFRETLPQPLVPGVNFCPGASKIGTATVKTPVLPNALEGAVYLASQNENPFGSLIAVYLVVKDPVSGVLIELAGKVSLSETGRLTTTFENSPQAPFEDAELHFFGGERAPFATPAKCGPYTTTSSIAPWSGNPASEPQSTFNITSGPNGSACPGATLPFSPALAAGTSNNNAGGFSPLSTTISRADGQQDLQSVVLHMPPGLSGILAGVALCPEAQANQGTCGPESLIGETTVTAGVGSDPVSVKGGRVYLTEKYGAAPFGLSIVNPVKAGPFDLEHDTSNPASQPPCDCVVVRASIAVDPHTAALTITTDPSGPHAIPHLIDGIPVQIKAVNVTITRPGFTFNPTSCNKMAITGAITSDEGASSLVSVPFQATNCKNLNFTPKFQVSTSGKTSRAKGASLSVKLTYPNAPQGTQANITRVKVDLPKQLPSRLTTLQKACTNAQFELNPANCPVASKIGFAKVTTPLLPVPLEGPAIFVSHGGEAFPSLTIVLQGYGVKVDLIGTTFISKKGITSTTFKTVPDVPFNTFSLTLPEGKYSALAANGNLCKTKLAMPTEFLAQNGAKINESTKIAVTGCKKAHKAKKKSKHKNKKAKSHKGGKR